MLIAVSSVTTAFATPLTVQGAKDALKGAIAKQEEVIKFKYEGDLAIAEMFHEAKKELGGFEEQNYMKAQITGKGNELTFNMVYKTPREEVLKTDKVLDQVLGAIIRDDMTDRQKVYQVYTYVMDTLHYEIHSVPGKETPENILKERNLWNALNGRGVVCDAYAMMFSKMTSKLGIENKMVTGKAGSISHIWNIVKIDGKWYNVDATNGDMELEDRIGQYKEAYGNKYTNEKYKSMAQADIKVQRQKYFLTSNEPYGMLKWDKSKYPTISEVNHK